MKRDEMIQLRTNLIRGIPPYEKDSMGNFVREKGGTRGLHELQKTGDFSPDSATLRMALDIQVKLIDHILERLR